MLDFETLAEMPSKHQTNNHTTASDKLMFRFLYVQEIGGK
jgi:hypothetical protein